MSNPWDLSPRECETLVAIAKCGTSKGTARELGISYRTVEGHMKSVIKKMKVSHRIQATLVWDRYSRRAEATFSGILVDRDITINGRFVAAGSVYKFAER